MLDIRASSDRLRKLDKSGRVVVLDRQDRFDK